MGNAEQHRDPQQGRRGPHRPDGQEEDDQGEQRQCRPPDRRLVHERVDQDPDELDGEQHRRGLPPEPRKPAGHRHQSTSAPPSTAGRRAFRCPPDGWVAIADNGSGDQVVLAPDDDAVRSWDHETGALRPVIVDWAVNDGLGDGKP